MFIEVNSSRHPLETGKIYLLGNKVPESINDNINSNFVLVEGNDVEDKHCMLEVSLCEEVFVVDLFSRLGVFVNGLRIKPMQKIAIKNEDNLKLASKEINLCLQNLENSHDSSGFLDSNKNTSDIINSSTDSFSHTESRLRRNDNNNFLKPAIPAARLSTTNKSFNITETQAAELSTNSLNSTKDKQNDMVGDNDSFIIPETQCLAKVRASTSSLNLSIAESNADSSKQDISFMASTSLADDDFCIPETQEIMPMSTKLLKDTKMKRDCKNLIEEKSVDLSDEGDNDENCMISAEGGSQFQICTQEFNDSSVHHGEDHNSLMSSQVIPFIKHTTILLSESGRVENRKSNIKQTENNFNKNLVDKEVSKLFTSKETAMQAMENDDNLDTDRSDCVTPDLFDFDHLQNPNLNYENDIRDIGKQSKDQEENNIDDDFLLPTQAFSVGKQSSAAAAFNKSVEQKDKKKADDFLTLSDKENLHPDIIEPVQEYPPTQLMATNEASSSRISNSPRVSSVVDKSNLSPKKTSDECIKFDSEEDEMLTQALSLTETRDKLQEIKSVTGKEISNTAQKKSPSNNLDNKQDEVFAQPISKSPSSVDKDVKIIKSVSSSEADKDELNGNDVTIALRSTNAANAANQQSKPTLSAKENTQEAEEDNYYDIPTQPFLTTNSAKSTHQVKPISCFNSTLLDGKTGTEKSPAAFFAEMEDSVKKTSLKTPPLATPIFKLPSNEFTSVRKNSSALSTTSTADSDIDLLMCTPQLIKENLNIEINSNVLAAIRNKNLFGDDSTDDDDGEGSDKHLIKLIRPKDTHDFDKLLPHLKDNTKLTSTDNSAERKSALEESKKYKFEILFGKDMDENSKSSSNKSASLSRDERHAARDKEKTVEQEKAEKPKKTSQRNKEKPAEDEKYTKKTPERQLPTKTMDKTEMATSSKAASEVSREKKTGKFTRKTKEDANETSNTGKNKEETAAKSSKKPKTKPTVSESFDDKKAKETSAAGTKQKNTNHTAKEPVLEGKTRRVTKTKTIDKEPEEIETIEPKTLRRQTSRSDIPKEKEPEQIKTIEPKTLRRQPSRCDIPKEEKKTTEKTENLKRTSKRLKTSESKEISQKDAKLAKKAKVTEQEVAPAKRTTRLTSNKSENVASITTSRGTRSKSRDVSASSTAERDISPSTSTSSRRTRTTSRNNTSQSSTSSSHTRSTSRNSALNTISRDSVEKTTTKTEAATETVHNKNERKRKSVVSKEESKPPVEEKRQRLRNSESHSMERTSSISTSVTKSSKCPVPCITMTMVDHDTFVELLKNSAGLWTVAKNPADSQILVMDKASRTFKFLLAMARGIPIVTSKWLQKINDTKSVSQAKVTDYLYSDESFEKKHKFTFIKSLQLANKQKLFDGYEFVTTSGILPNASEMKVIVESCGGKFLVKTPAPKPNQKLYLISTPNDRKDWRAFRHLNKNIEIISTEAIMSAVIRQHVSPLSHYVLS